MAVITITKENFDAEVLRSAQPVLPVSYTHLTLPTILLV